MSKFFKGQFVQRNHKIGQVIDITSRPKKIIGNLILGPYPELYVVKWSNEEVKTYLPHGIQKISTGDY